MNNENLEIYNRLRSVPEEACRPITSGELAGLTNITPQWRIETLTSEFGPCGIGWIYDPPQYRFEKTDSGEVICFCSTNLYFKYGGEWSRPIPGEGGNKFVTKTYDGYKVNDECCKMALTDALSTAAKMLGLAADIYYKDGRDGKYTEIPGDGTSPFSMPAQQGNTNGSVTPVQPASVQTMAPVAPAQNQYPAPIQQTQPVQQYTNPPVQSPAQKQTITGQSKTNPQPQPQHVCSGCGTAISDNIADFSQKKYSRKLCLVCQKSANQPAQPSVDSAPLNRSDALSRIFPVGKYMNKTLAEVIAIDRKTIEVYANDRDGRYRRDFPDFWRACKAVLA